MSENKTSKYFKYAIGEILLVVIGILIALQINNWNEANKKQDLKEEYKIALINDYIKDTIQLGNRIRYNEKNLTYIDSLINLYNKENLNEDDIFKLVRQNNFPLTSRITNAYNTNSFDLLISSGSIDLFNKKIRQEIMELNRLQNYEKQVSQSNKTIFFNSVQTITKKYPLYSSFDGFSRHLSDLSWKTVNIESLLIDVVNFYGVRRYMSDRYLQLTEDIQKQTKKLIFLLKDSADD